MSDFGGGRKLPSHKIEPKYNGYQLIGDNQFLRFSQSLLSIKRTKLNGFKFSGLCVKDQKIIDLLRRIHIGFGDVSEKVVVMIGTNDLLCGTNFEAMCEDFKELLKLLSQNAKKIILLTVPPIPKLKKNVDHWNRLKKFNDLIRQCRDDEKIFVGDAYAQFVVSKEFPHKKSCPSKSHVVDFSSCPKSTPIRFSKWLLPSVANGGKMCRPVIPSPSSSNVNQPFPPVKRFRATPPLLPPDQEFKTVQKVIRRRPFYSHFPSLTPSSSDDSFPLSWQSTPKKKKCESYLCPLTSVPDFDLFISPGSVNTSAKKFNSYHLSPAPSSGSEDPFVTRSGRVPTHNRKCNSLTTKVRRIHNPARKCNSSFFTTTPSSGDDLFLAPKGRDNSFFSPVVSSSGEDDSFSTSSRTARGPRVKCDSLFSPPVPSSSDNGSSVTLSKSVLIPQTRCNSYSRADDNHIDRSGKGNTEDEVNIENADKIRDECFEMCISGDCKRPDLIHLNIRGLCALRGIIQGIIDIIEENYS